MNDKEEPECPWDDINEFFSEERIAERKKTGKKIITKIGSSRIFFYEEGQTKFHYLDGGILKAVTGEEESESREEIEKE